MSYIKLLSDRCDIYHLKKREVPGQYGLPGETEHYYDTVANHYEVPSRWVARGAGDVVQTEPFTKIVESYLVHFDKDIDPRLHDRVIYNGCTFTLQIPRLIQNHHWEVVAVREEKL